MTAAVSLLVAATAVLVAAGCGSSAEERKAALNSTSYTVQAWAECPPRFIDSGSWGQDGRLYLPCNDTRINVYDASGSRVQQIETGRSVSDVAPSPDARYLYLALGTNMPRRMARQADGSYVLDQGWRPANYNPNASCQNGSVTPRGHYIDTDGAGNIYLSDGGWTEGQGDDGRNRGGGYHSIVKYTPDGACVTSFGERVDTWADGKFWWMTNGLAVTQDGASVYTTEVGNNRVQRFDRQGDGSYRSSFRVGSTQANNADRGGNCVADGYDGRLAAPYDVELDEAGNIFVLNTTCHQVLKFNSGGQPLFAKTLGSDATSGRPHSFAVSKDGKRIFVHEEGKMLFLGGAPAGDRDGDGVANDQDDCIDDRGPSSNRGCPLGGGNPGGGGGGPAPGGGGGQECDAARQELADAKKRLSRARDAVSATANRARARARKRLKKARTLVNGARAEVQEKCLG